MWIRHTTCQSFADKYNELIDFLNGKLNEKYGNFPPHRCPEAGDEGFRHRNWEKRARTGCEDDAHPQDGNCHAHGHVWDR